ncbi:hypothetical protein JCM17844_11340 [Iodidimonas gelatinilytica]|uniref:Phosphoenolpyruvate synthase regulatory protein n=1 Tax=Iodidimonas gelatinilytica TaxID=1236966 RepID=A0A5A7MNF3_9PROT|nr:kinase/pyrophosphorylase [Iodidimonas gelatinilytica]GEQ97497.1 hypothetical protein JCM17844_11340 [Iodidimonas gelatinilytica]GER01599.1 hypothetical protein JCM17845_22220 [Iodidimonas gelatinilytica]
MPFVPNAPLPPELEGPLDALVVGLTASPDRLVQVRTNRLRTIKEAPSTSYVDMQAIKEEVLACRRLCSAHHWPVIDVTRRSIEETAAAVLRLHSAREAGLSDAGK